MRVVDCCKRSPTLEKMSSGIVILRALRDLTIKSAVRSSASRIAAATHQAPLRFCSSTEGQSNEKGASVEESKEESRDPKDRSIKIPVETSIRYLKSRAYQATYGDEPVWVPYRRNFSGQRRPIHTRKSCIKRDRVVTGNPCPICRDEYLVLHETNVDLLKQFISPFTGEVLGYNVTNVCRRQHDNLMVAILKARDQGLLTYDVPFRHYNYDEYKKTEQQQ